MERTTTGIPGLDELIEGGLPSGSTVLVSGGAGTCKTILGTAFIHHGAKESGEPGIFVTMEGNVQNILWNIENFGWDIQGLQKKNLMKIYRLHLNPTENIDMQIEAELNTIADLVKSMGAKRLVVDSTTAFAVWLKDAGAIRSMLYAFADRLKEFGCTTILIAETKGGKKDFSAFGVEEFVSDGVIALYFMPPHRSIFVRKMRGTNHSKTVHPFDINEQGMIVRPKDEIMWEAIKD